MKNQVSKLNRVAVRTVVRKAQASTAALVEHASIAASAVQASTTVVEQCIVSQKEHQSSCVQ